MQQYRLGDACGEQEICLQQTQCCSSAATERKPLSWEEESMSHIQNQIYQVDVGVLTGMLRLKGFKLLFRILVKHHFEE